MKDHWINILYIYSPVLSLSNFAFVLLILNKDIRITFTNFWTCNHRFPIETGRWNNNDKNLRKYTKCDAIASGWILLYFGRCTNFANDKKNDSSKRNPKIPNIRKFYVIKLRADEYCEVEKLKHCQNVLWKFSKSSNCLVRIPILSIE